MNIDHNAKRYWPLIVCAMLGIAAYFQASAISSLVSASLGGEPHVPATTTAGSAETRAPAPTSAPILDRNPFDSTTGTIDAPEGDDDDDDDEPTGGVAECSKGRVVLIAQNDDPKWAFASIDDGSGSAQLRRVGDEFGNFRVESLSWDRVYLTESGKRCFLAMGGKLPTGTASRDPSPSSKADTPAGIKKVSNDKFEMDRETMDAILGKPGGLLGRTRVTPMKKGDRVTGLKLGNVGSDSTLDELGLKTGDVLQSMSGTQLTSPEKLVQAYERMHVAEIFRLRILRGGVPTQIEFRVR